ncbi:MAG: LysR family transcriptional regulator [Deltaproteobacteria bacterium]|nr:MAG: LysR family transcriptional regulator [Deltaproteobacteria bacterium]
MDWRAIRFDWNRSRAFLVTAEEGTFSAAGEALGLSQPTVGRQVAALEEELGVALFERVGSRLELTGAGLELLDHVRAMAEAATRLSLSATGQSTSIEGTVVITASELISAFHLPPVVRDLRRTHPAIELELVASNAVRDLLRREADIAIRNTPPEHPDLVARRLSDRRARLYASPAYLETLPPLERPEDLVHAEILAFDRSPLMIDGFRAMGVELGPENFRVIAANHLVQWELCKGGVGLCMVMQEVGDAEPRVVPVLPEVAIPIPMWLISHRELRTSRRIRVVFDALAEALG